MHSWRCCNLLLNLPSCNSGRRGLVSKSTENVSRPNRQGHLESMTIARCYLQAVYNVPVTLTVKKSSWIFPAVSTAEQLTLVKPISKVLPESRSHVTVVELSQLSVAVALKYTTALQDPVLVNEWISGRASNTGASISALKRCQDLICISTVNSQSNFDFQSKHQQIAI